MTTYSEVTIETVKKLPRWNNEITGSKSRRYTSKKKINLSTCLQHDSEQVKDSPTARVDYRHYYLKKKSSCYDYKMAPELDRIAKKKEKHKKHRSFLGKEAMLVVVSLQEFKSACDACKLHESTTIWLFTVYSTGLAKVAVNARITLLIFTNTCNNGTLRSHYTVFQHPWLRFAVEDNKVRLNAEVRRLRQEWVIPAKSFEAVCKRTLNCGSVYHEVSDNAMF